jgi:hypothetical protein
MLELLWVCTDSSPSSQVDLRILVFARPAGRGSASAMGGSSRQWRVREERRGHLVFTFSS